LAFVDLYQQQKIGNILHKSIPDKIDAKVSFFLNRNFY